MATNKPQIEKPLFGAVDSWAALNRHMFPSDGALRWYFRNHRDRLVREGAVMRLRGQWFATDRLMRAIVKIAAEETPQGLPRSLA